MGLGTGTYDARANGLDIDFELERIVGENGNQIQTTSHYGARPFNKEELDKISRVGVCMGCHKSFSNPIWKDVTKLTCIANNPEAHASAVGKLLSSAVEKPAGEKGICGPTAVVLISMLPLAIYGIRRRG